MVQLAILILIIIAIIKLQDKFSSRQDTRSSIVGGDCIPPTDTTPAEGSEPIKDRLQSMLAAASIDDTLDSETMIGVIRDCESSLRAGADAADLYWLGVAYNSYCAWFIRGDDRRRYLLRAIGYFERSFDRSKGSLPVVSDDEFHWLSQTVIAGEVGRILIEEAPVRDIKRGRFYLEFVYRSIDQYDPSLCALAHSYYMEGDFEKSVEIARELKKRAAKSSDFKDVVMPSRQIVSGLRAMRNRDKKAGDYKSALKWSKQMMRIKKMVTETDIKKHEALLGLVENTR